VRSTTEVVFCAIAKEAVILCEHRISVVVLTVANLLYFPASKCAGRRVGCPYENIAARWASRADNSLDARLRQLGQQHAILCRLQRILILIAGGTPIDAAIRLRRISAFSCCCSFSGPPELLHIRPARALPTPPALP